MLHQWRFIASLGIDLVGFLAQLVALRRLPLFAVQAMIAANLAVTAVFAAWLMQVMLTWREWLAVGGVVTGVGLLGSSAGSEGAADAGPAFQLALIVAVAGIALAGLAAARLPNPARTPVLGAVAGSATRARGGRPDPARVLAAAADPVPGQLCAGGGGDRVVHAVRRRAGRGSVTVVHVAVVLAETTPPALVGVVFPRRYHPHGLTAVAALGFGLAVVLRVALARFGEATEEQETESASRTCGRPAGIRAHRRPASGRLRAARARAGSGARPGRIGGQQAAPTGRARPGTGTRKRALMPAGQCGFQRRR